MQYASTDLRLECLRLAQPKSDGQMNTDFIIERAQAYLNFVTSSADLVPATAGSRLPSEDRERSKGTERTSKEAIV